MDVRTPFKDSVVETFLRRKLTFVQFESLRYYSAGAVCDSQTRNLRFVVVLADAVYSTENVNPCTLRCELRLAQLLRLQQVADFAEFLSGEFRNKAQHVSCVYRPAPAASEPRENETSARHKPNSNTATSIMTTTQRARTRAHSEAASSSLNTLQSNTLASLSQLPIPFAQSLTFNDSLNQNDEQHAESETDTQRLLSHRSAKPSAFRKFFPSRKKTLTFNEDTAKSSLANHSFNATDSSLTLPATQTLKSDLQLNATTSPNATATAELHLYELVSNAQFLYVLQSTAFNYALEHAYVQEDYDASLTQTQTQTQTPFNQTHLTLEKTKSLFSQLSTDILQADCQQESFELINELKVACSRYFVVRRQFWRAPELFAHLVTLLQQISTRWSQPQVGNIHTYVNELEYAVLILETLSACLRGTDAYLSRMDALLRNNGASLRQLVVLITRVPTRTGANVALDRAAPSGDYQAASGRQDYLNGAYWLGTDSSDGLVEDFLRTIKTARSAQKMQKHEREQEQEPRVLADLADAESESESESESGLSGTASAARATEAELCLLISDYVAAGASVMHQLILGCRFMHQLNEQAYSQKWIQQCIERHVLMHYCEILLLHLIHVYLIPPKSGTLKMTRSLSVSLSATALQHYPPLTHTERAYLCEELLLLSAILKTFNYKDVCILERLNALCEVDLKYFAKSYFIASRLTVLHDEKLVEMNDTDCYLNSVIIEELENLKSTLASH